MYVCMHVHVYYVCIFVCIYGVYICMYIFRHCVYKRAYFDYIVSHIVCTYRKRKNKFKKKVFSDIVHDDS